MHNTEREAEVYKQLMDSKPDIKQMVEVFEDEIEMFVDSVADNFDEIFHDRGVALNAYEGLTEDDQPTVNVWQSEVLNHVINRWHNKLAERVANK